MHIVVIDIPAPEFKPVRKRATGKLQKVNVWLNSNQRLHRMQEVKLTKAWRQAAAEAARAAVEVHGELKTPVRIVAHVWKPRGGRYDPNNLWPTVKACADGLVDVGLLEDDDYTRVIGPDLRHGGIGHPQLILMIEVPS
jgi:crossover junction endodeoxyribonuclease RusA